MYNMFKDFSPYIEYVDQVRNNPSDAKKVVFQCKGNPTEIIKWCRRNFGDRGDGWDFAGGLKSVDIIIWSSKLIMMYELWQR